MAKRKAARPYKTPWSVPQIRANAKACGSHYFDKDTVRYFRSRVSSKVSVSPSKRCSYFVTSESQGGRHRRLYSVRKICGCQVDTVGEFQGHATLKAAQAAARRAAKKG